MANIKNCLTIILLLALTGCCVFPARVVMPLSTRVVDATDGTPVASAEVLRIVGDVHDRQYTRASVERWQSDKMGRIKASGKHKWGIWALAPGGMPVPNHHIAIWKEGYYAMVFSQYGTLSDIDKKTTRKDILDAISEVPVERRTLDKDPEKAFLNGEVKLYRLKR